MVERLVPLLLLALAAAPAAAQAPDPEALSRLGQETLARLSEAGSSYTATHTLLTSPTRVVVDVTRAAGIERWVVTLEARGQRQEVARILARDGVWYVREEGRTFRCRPYEALLALPSTYHFLARSDLLCLVDPAGLEGAALEGQAGGVASWRVPLDPAGAGPLQRALAQLEPLRGQSPDMAKRVDEMKALLERGLPLGVDLKTGQIVQRGYPKMVTTWTPVASPPATPAKELEPGPGPWEDRTSDPTAGDRSQLLMLGSNGLWRPGQPAGDLDLCLVDAATGRLRRVPYDGGAAIGGCFDADRTRAFVCGQTEGGFVPVEVDLHTGSNRVLGEGLRPGGAIAGLALSPDGKTLATAHLGVSEVVLESRVALVDVASGKGRYVGEPLDTGFVSWLPDGSGLVLLRRRTVGMDRPAEGTICRMALPGGAITELCPGDSPVVLGQRILFEGDGDRWMTCDLQGKDAQLFCGGLPKHGFPSPSPDGTQVLLMRFVQGTGPRPVAVTVADGAVRELPLGGGLWAMPAWR